MFKILDLLEIEKNNKNYFVVKLYCNYSDVILSCFVDKKTFEDLRAGKINNENIVQFLHLKVDKDMKFHVFIK